MLVQLLPDDLLTWPLLDVLVIVILSPSIMMIFIYISWRVRQRQRRQKDLAPQNVVTNLPVKIFRQVERKENEPEECAICLEDYVDGEELRILPCRHEFHVGCVDAWLTTRKKFVSLLPCTWYFVKQHTVVFTDANFLVLLFLVSNMQEKRYGR